MKKLLKIFFFLGSVCLPVLILQDFLFFWYVESFNNLEYSLYLKIDRLLQDSVIFLLFPAAYALFRLSKIDQASSKVKLIFYFLYGAMLPFFFFRAFEAEPGYLSYDHTSFSAITWARLNLKVILITVVAFCVLPVLASLLAFLNNKNRAGKLKQFWLTIAGVFGSIAFALAIVFVTQTQIHNVLNRLMLDNIVETTLPKLPNLKNQEIVIADHSKPVIDCYLKQNPGDLTTRMSNLIIGTSFLDTFEYNTYYLNDHCLVVYVGIPLTLTRDTNPTSAALLSESLIRLFYGELIHLNVDKHPANTVSIKGEETFKKGIGRGSYDSDTNTIVLQWGYDKVFATITHELLHSFATTHVSPLGDFESGLGEAITEYLTAGIMHYMAAPYKLHIYEDQVHAFEKLLTYVDRDTVLEAYFNGDLQSLQKEVDSKTYPGAYCRFNGYLDQSIVEYNKNKNYQLSKEYSAKAEQALETIKGDDLNCF